MLFFVPPTSKTEQILDVYLFWCKIVVVLFNVIIIQNNDHNAHRTAVRQRLIRWHRSGKVTVKWRQYPIKEADGGLLKTEGGWASNQILHNKHVHDDVMKWKHFALYWPLRPVTRSFDIFSDLGPNISLSKQLRGWWFETPSHSLWRNCYGYNWSEVFSINQLPMTQNIK